MYLKKALFPYTILSIVHKLLKLKGFGRFIKFTLLTQLLFCEICHKIHQNTWHNSNSQSTVLYYMYVNFLPLLVFFVT